MSAAQTSPQLGMTDAQKRTAAMREQMAELENNMPLILRLQAAQATITRAKFLSLIEEGFSAPQAIELCKAPL